MIQITLPLPPTANFYWRKWRGRMVLSAEARAYKAEVAKIATIARIRAVPAWFELELAVYFPNLRGDLTNRLKILEDALQPIAYLNDSKARRVVLERHQDPRNPRVEVTVKPCEGPHAPSAIPPVVVRRKRREACSTRARARLHPSPPGGGP